MSPSTPAQINAARHETLATMYGNLAACHTALAALANGECADGWIVRYAEHGICLKFKVENGIADEPRHARADCATVFTSPRIAQRVADGVQNGQGEKPTIMLLSEALRAAIADSMKQVDMMRAQMAKEAN